MRYKPDIKLIFCVIGKKWILHSANAPAEEKFWTMLESSPKGAASNAKENIDPGKTQELQFHLELKPQV